MHFLSANGDLSMPFLPLLIPPHSGHAGCIAAIQPAIVAVNLRRHVTQIARTVVSLDAVNMVNVTLRPFAMGQRPDNSVGQKVFL